MLKCMTFNIRFANSDDGLNGWEHRRDWIGEIIREAQPDVLGLQEPLARQVADLVERLPGYAWYGVGRADGKRQGEFNPLFWRDDRFTLAESGTFWLSETPDVPGSIGWDSRHPRLASWVKLRDDVGEMLACNTHLAFHGPEARERSAAVLRDRFRQLAGELPCVLTGDFNCTADEPPHAELIKRTGDFRLADARDICTSPPAGPDSTWNGFRDLEPGRRIDHVLVRGFAVARYEVMFAERHGRFPSDHFPVVVELER